ncbi:hypothetical protein FRC08_004000, partial [Ceratobasidium sp. 394]
LSHDDKCHHGESSISSTEIFPADGGSCFSTIVVGGVTRPRIEPEGFGPRRVAAPAEPRPLPR